MRIVLDTSVLYKLYVAELDSDRAEEILSSVVGGRIEAHVPTLVRYELLSALTKGMKIVGHAESHLRHFDDLLFDGYITEHEPTLDRLISANKLAFLDTNSKRYISSYDDSYHALAIELGAIFVTADKPQVRRTENLLGNITALDRFEIPSKE